MESFFLGLICVVLPPWVVGQVVLKSRVPVTRHFFCSPDVLDTEESSAGNAAASVIFQGRRCPLALSRRLVQTWTGDEKTPEPSLPPEKQKNRWRFRKSVTQVSRVCSASRILFSGTEHMLSEL